MKVFATILSLLYASNSVRSFPQQDGASLSAKDVINSAADSSRYGQNSGAIDPSILEDVFGTGPSGGNSNSVEVDVGEPGGYIEDDKYDNCTYYAEYGFECVPYYQCAGGYIITDGGGLFDIRSGLQDTLDPAGSKCESYLEVCCRDESFSDVPLPKRPVTTTTTPRPITTTTTTQKPVPLNKCGRRNINGVGVRIQNDAYQGSTQFGEWPHMCAVLRQGELGGNSVNLYVCGASLIAPGVALTGAHCVKDYLADPSVIKVRCGEWDTQQTIEPRRHEDRNAYEISLHPLFNERNLQNDVALIHLKTDFVLQPHINTICLPDQDLPSNLDYYSDNCFATGWGKDKFGKEGEYQVIMKQVKMDLVEHPTCQDILRTTRLGKRFRLDESFLCAGGTPGEDTCKGDGGGPLVCPKNLNNDPYDQQYVQTGIVAWGLGCGSDIPGVYANVSDALCYIDWATKCVHGQDADFYGYNGCRDWAKRQYCQYKDELIQAKAAAEDSINALRKQKKMEDLTRRLESAIQSCKYGPHFESEVDCSYYDDYYEDSDDLDLSGNAREGDPNANAYPKSADDSDDYTEDDDDEADDDDDDEAEESFGRSGAESK